LTDGEAALGKNNLAKLPLKIRLLRWLLRRAATRHPQQVAWAMSTFLSDDELFDSFKAYDRYCLRAHYNLPIPDELDLEFAQRESELPGISIDDDACLGFLTDVVNKYKSEFSDFPVEKSNSLGYFLANGTFMAVDGNVYYAVIREFRPRTVIEIGSGNSTLLAASAIRRNISEGGDPTRLLCVEPFPVAHLQDGSVPEVSLIKERVQNVPLSLFESLQAGDVLFIDSTHALRAGGDVCWEFCEILPRLAPGVLVHIHDISLPKAYPASYAKNRWYWNEQYLLQAFLAFNSKFEVIWPGSYLYCKHRSVIDQAFSPELSQMVKVFPDATPASFWMRVRE